jgi:hypothetical protein
VVQRLAATLVAVAALAAVPAAAHADSIGYDIQGTKGDNGWYVSPVTLTWHVSGVAIGGSCVLYSQVTIPGDTAGQEETCEVDGAAVRVTIKIDRTAPSGVVAAPARPPDANGWYRQPVNVSWSGKDAMSGIASCTSATHAGPDSATARLDGVCRDRAGNESAAVPFALKYDATPPAVRGLTPERPPDRAGWYVGAIGFAPQGADATSGIDACPPVVYAGPDSADATVTGTCTDRAGNQATATDNLRYDATAPTFSVLTAERKRARLTLRWQASDDTTSVTVQRRPEALAPRTFAGAAGTLTDSPLTPGLRYVYEVTATDAAGNTTTQTVRSRRPSALLSPAFGAKLRKPPTLRWRRVKGASYYNVQLFVGGRKVLSAWPTRTRLRLHRHWRYAGVRRSLRSGTTVTWYVWPGLGKRSDHRYGRALGAGRFTMR